MKKIERRASVCFLLALFLLAGMGLFLVRYGTEGGSWVSAAFNRHLYDSSGQLASGTVLDRDGDPLSFVENGKRTYHESADVRKSTLHVVGDLQGNIGTGALNAFADQLTGYNRLNGAFGAAPGNELYLTIDARYHYEAYRALDGRPGAVAVYNYKTGEILCLVSSPAYDPLNVPADLETNEAYHGAYLNRALSSVFTPGSIFKTVTLEAAIEQIPDLFQRSWHCDGSTQIGGERITCSGVHGDQNIGEAFSHSCNVVFAQLAQELGGETLMEYAEKAGLTERRTVDGLPTGCGSVDLKGASDARVAWAGVGQDQDLVNPLAMMVYMGAIGGGGTAAEPYLVERIQGSLGLPSLPKHHGKTVTLVEPDTAATLAEMMSDNVKNSYGAKRFPNMDLCAKSGTAEVGGGKPHAWFTGFLRNEETPYAFVVLVEHGGGGSSVAGTVAGKVLNVMVNGY